MSVRKYFKVFTLTWQEYLAYRLNFGLEVLGGIFQTLVTLAVWILLFHFHSAQEIGNFSEQEMVTYIVGGGVIASFLLLHGQGDDIDDDINRGDLSAVLVKPIGPNLFWLVKDACRKYFTFFLGVMFYAVILFLFRDALLAPVSGGALLLFSVFVLVAALLHFGLFYIFSILAFWFDRTWAPRALVRNIMELASGLLVPLSFFPPFWEHVLAWLPFSFFAYVPMQVYLGNFSTIDIMFALARGAGWLLIIFIVARILWRRGLRAYSAQGI